MNPCRHLFSMSATAIAWDADNHSVAMNQVLISAFLGYLTIGPVLWI